MMTIADERPTYMTNEALTVEQYWRDPEAFVVPRIKAKDIKTISGAWLREYHEQKLANGIDDDVLTPQMLDLRWAIYWINRGLIYREIKRHSASQYWEEIEREACDAMFRAIHGFDPTLGFEFSTYATWAVRRSAGLGRVLKSGSSRDCEMASFNPDHDERQHHDAPYIADRAEIVCAAMEEVLDSRELDIVRRRFGIGEHDQHTLADIGAVHGLSKERVRQIELVALRRLRPRLASLSA